MRTICKLYLYTVIYPVYIKDVQVNAVKLKYDPAGFSFIL